MSEYRTEAEAVAAVAREATEPDILEPGLIYAFRDGDGNVHIHATEQYDQHPWRKKTSRVVVEQADLVSYVEKHANPNTELWASLSAGTIDAVIDAPAGDGGPAGWEEHTIRLRLTQTRDWIEFTRNDRQWMGQAEFAEFIEDHVGQFITPDAATMLELAQTFQAAKSVDFKSSHRLANGQTSLSYVENIEAKAGRKGDITIPERIELAIEPYEGSNPYKVTARFRHRIHDGDLHLAIFLDRPQDILRAAFNNVIDYVAGETGRTVWHTP